MTLNSYGYSAPSGAIASILTDQWAGIYGHAGSDYSIAPYLGDGATAGFEPSIATGDRRISLSRGIAYGRGVMDVSDAAEVLPLDDPGSGSRWYVGGLRRDWQGGGGGTGASSLVVLGYSTATDETAAVAAVIAARQQSPGITQDDQPLFSCRIDAGNTQPQALRDLRCWAGPGGMVAKSTHALAYLSRLSTSVLIDGVTWRRGFDGASPAWFSSTNTNAVTLLGKGNPISGGTTLTSAGVYLQAATEVKTSDSNGLAQIIFPQVFPNALLAVVPANGDANIDSAVGSQLEMSRWGSATRAGFTYAVMRAGTSPSLRVPNLLHRVDWFAIGY